MPKHFSSTEADNRGTLKLSKRVGRNKKFIVNFSKGE